MSLVLTDSIQYTVLKLTDSVMLLIQLLKTDAFCMPACRPTTIAQWVCSRTLSPYSTCVVYSCWLQPLH